MVCQKGYFEALADEARSDRKRLNRILRGGVATKHCGLPSGGGFGEYLIWVTDCELELVESHRGERPELLEQRG